MRRALGDRLTGSALALMLTTAVTSGLGLLFWAVAAQLFSLEAVGRASAAISAATLLAGLAQLNLAAILMRFVPAAGVRTRWLVARAFLVTIALAAVLTAAFLGIGLGRTYLDGSARELALFCVAVLAFLVAPLTEATLAALRRAPVVLAQSSVFAVSKLVALVAVAGLAPGLGVVAAWVAPQAGVLVVVVAFLFGVAIPRHERASAGRSAIPVRRRLWSFIGAEYLRSVLTVVASLAMPLLVVHRLGLAATAFLTVPWLIASSMNLLLYNVSSSFVVENQFEPEAYRRQLRRTIAIGAALTVTVTVVLFAAAPLLLGVLGGAYAAEGTTFLRLLALAFPFCGLGALYATFAWLETRMWRLVALQAGNAALLFGGSYLWLDDLGIDAVGIAYLLANVALGLGSIPPILRRLRRAGHFPSPNGAPHVTAAA